MLLAGGALMALRLTARQRRIRRADRQGIAMMIGSVVAFAAWFYLMGVR